MREWTNVQYWVAEHEVGQHATSSNRWNLLSGFTFILPWGHSLYHCSCPGLHTQRQNHLRTKRAQQGGSFTLNSNALLSYKIHNHRSQMVIERWCVVIQRSNYVWFVLVWQFNALNGWLMKKHWLCGSEVQLKQNIHFWYFVDLSLLWDIT